MTDIPQLAWPIKFAPSGTDLEYVEQDSPLEHAQSAALVLAVPTGSLIDEPTFGTPDPVFAPGGADIDAMQASLRTWEPRIPASIAADAIADRAQEINVTIETANG